MSSSDATHIAVLVMDDSVQDATDLARLIEASPCAREAGFELALEVRAGGVDELERAVATGLPDIAFVDIRLSDEADAPTGIDAVEAVFAGTAVQVVYVSAYDSYHTQVYRTDHASFVKKPASAADVDAALGHALRRLRERRAAPLVLHVRGAERVVDPASIVYLESDRRRVRVHLAGEVVEVYGKLGDFQRSLPASFARCHQSVLVNLDHVSALGKTDVRMVTGDELPVSRRHRAAMREALVAHVRAGR